MVTVVPLMEHAPLAVIVGTVVIVPPLLVAMAKVDLYAAVAGAPVKVTVGAIVVAFVDWLSVVPW